MKAWPKTLVSGVVWSCVLTSVSGAVDQAADAMIQTIQQAPDPSAAIAAFASGFAADRNNPKLYDAYVSRMVELGLPEMAFHQAETLTTLQVTNGVAWGVIAYVDARRAQMPEAISAINLAGRFAPDSKFIQHTAGELVAWYDVKADKSAVPENAKNGLAKMRVLLDQRPTFTEAYSTAQRAYQDQTSAATPPAQAPGQYAPAPAMTNTPPTPSAPQAPVSPQVQADPYAPPGYAPPPPVYYPAYADWGPDYCYGWGAGWVAPAPWCWWWPWGYWGGCCYYPFGVSFVFCDSDDFHHGDHHGDGGHHDGHSGHNGDFAGRHDPTSWHGGREGRSSFYGAPAKPAASGAQWARVGSPRSSSSAAASSSGSRWWGGVSERNSLAATRVNSQSTRPGQPLGRYGAGSSGVSPTRAGSTVASSGRSWSSGSSRPNPAVRTASPSAPLTHHWTGNSGTYPTAPAGRSTGASFQNYSTRTYAAPSGRSPAAAPSSRAPAYAYSTPRPAVPSGRSFGASGGWHTSSPMSAPAPRSFGGSASGFGGGSSSGGGMRSSGSSGGGFSGGGSRGGGFSGGSHGGGGRR